jgi:hypothetical protein
MVRIRGPLQPLRIGIQPRQIHHNLELASRDNLPASNQPGAEFQRIEGGGMRRGALILSLLLIAVSGLWAAAPKEHYLGTVILPDTLRKDMEGPTAQIEIGIEHYTPNSVMDDLGAILGDGNNQAGLLQKFQKMKRSGWVALMNRPGVDIKVIREQKTPEGREITLLTDRPIGIWEAVNSPVTQEYPYGMMKFIVNDKGEGSGTIYPIVRVKSIGPNGIKIEDYGVIPLQVPKIQLAR